MGAESGDGGGAVVVDEIVGMGDVHGSLLRAYARAYLIDVYVVAGDGALNTQFLGGGDGNNLVAGLSHFRKGWHFRQNRRAGRGGP